MGAALKIQAPNLSGLSEIQLLEVLSKSAPGSAEFREVQSEILRLAKARETKRQEKARAFKEIIRLGSETVSENAKAMREDWRAHLTAYLSDGYRESKIIGRQEAIREIRGFSLMRRYTGKNGGQISYETIKRWLTTKLEKEIRVDALTQSRNPVSTL